MLIDHHPATGVVRGGNHGDRLFGDVDAEAQAALINSREVAFDERFRLVADVEINAVDTQALHFMVDGPRDNVTRRQLGAFVEAIHEALAVGQLQMRAFATQRFSDQETLGLRVIQTGRMELVEFQVRHPATGTPGHGDAVTAGAVGVAGIKVDLGRAARGQNHETCAVGVDFAGGAVQYVGAEAAIAFHAQAALGDQINGHPLFQQFDVLALFGLGQQGLEDRSAGGVGSMDDPSMAVATFAGQVKFETTVFSAGLFVAGEGHALVNQPLDGFAAVLDGEAYGVFMAQAAARIEGVVDMGFDSVGIVEHGGNAALGPECRTVGEIAFAQYGNAQMTGQGQSESQTGSTAANHQNIVLELLAHFRIPLKATRVGVGARQLDRRVKTATQPTSI